MWTIVRFGLRAGGDYRAAFELLAPAGFLPHQGPGESEPGPFPASLAADTSQDPAAVTRAVFEGLARAGLGPIGVAACHAGAAPRRLARPLARA